MNTPPPTREFTPDDPTSVQVWVDGLRFDVEVTTASLLTALAAGGLHSVLPGLLPPEQQTAWLVHLYDSRTPFDLPDAQAVTAAVVEYLTGVPHTTAVAIGQWAADEWLLLRGYHRARGVELLALSPRELIGVLYAFILEHRFEGDAAKANAVLFPAVKAARPASDGGAGFLAAMQSTRSLPGVE